MDYRVSKIFLYVIVASALFAALPVCAKSQNAVPVSAMTAAEQALASADAVQARDLAPGEYQQAEAALQAANTQLGKRKGKDAERLAEQARLYADLAAAKARYIRIKETVEERTSANAALRRELFLGQDGGHP